MASREQSERSAQQQNAATETVLIAPAVSIQTHNLDSLLDEIDDVLEVNAEEFVRSYVQKGGQ